jgi:anti-sigma-K factor RskA
VTIDAPIPDGPEPDVAAAELALGLLEGDERAAALRRMLAEPAFARDVERWRAHFGALFALLPAVEPGPDAGRRVIARLDGPAPARARPSPWKPFALASSLAAASLLGVLVTRPRPVAPPVVTTVPAPAPMVAAFMIEGQPAPLVATYDATRGLLSMPGPMPIPAGKSAQLWAIVGTGAPQPLGLFHEAGVRVEAEARSAAPMAPGTTFAISIEPAGGSPTGLPTGPVVGSATLIRA